MQGVGLAGGEAGWHPVLGKTPWVLRCHDWGICTRQNVGGPSEVTSFHLPILQMSLECSGELHGLDQPIRNRLRLTTKASR